MSANKQAISTTFFNKNHYFFSILQPIRVGALRGFQHYIMQLGRCICCWGSARNRWGDCSPWWSFVKIWDRMRRLIGVLFRS